MTEQAYIIDKADLRASFDRSVTTYDAHAILQKEVGTRLLERLEFIKIQPQTVLDAGTGTGTQSLALMKKFRKARLISLDIAPLMLGHARKRKPWLAKQWFLCADVEYTPLADNSIDLIYSNLTFQWCTEYDRVFAEIQRILKPNGLFIFSTLGPDTLKELRDSWNRVDQEIHVNAFMDMHDVGDAMVRSGFQDPVVDMENFQLTYEDVYTLMRDLKAIGAHNLTRGRPQGLTGKGRMQAMLSQYECYRVDGRIPATYEVIYGHAWGRDLDKRKGSSHEVSIPLDAIRRPSGTRT